MWLEVKGRKNTYHTFFLKEPLWDQFKPNWPRSCRVGGCRWGNAAVAAPERCGPAPFVLPHHCLDCALPSFPGQSAQWDAEPEGTWLSPSTISKLLVYLSCIVKYQVSCCSRASVYPKSKIKEGVRGEALINLTLLWTKSSQRDCIFSLPGQMCGVCAQLVCVCEGFLVRLPGTEMSLICTISFYWSLQGQGNVTGSKRVLNTYYCR